jgi:hypothetical protein
MILPSECKGLPQFQDRLSGDVEVFDASVCAAARFDYCHAFERFPLELISLSIAIFIARSSSNPADAAAEAAGPG